MVIVVAEGAGEDLIAESIQTMKNEDASGNKLLLDVGLWLSQKIKEHFVKIHKVLNLKYIDPTYIIRAIPRNASDNVYSTLLAHSVIHGAMARYTGFTVGMVNGRHAYIPFHKLIQAMERFGGYEQWSLWSTIHINGAMELVERVQHLIQVKRA